MAFKIKPENPFESDLAPLTDEEVAKTEKSRAEVLAAVTPSKAELLALEKASADRYERQREKERAASAARKSNRIVGALVLLLALGLVAAGIFLHTPHAPWESTIGSTTAMSMRIVGLVFGFKGLQMLVFGSREDEC